MRKFHRTTAGNCSGTSLTAGRSKPAIPTNTEGFDTRDLKEAKALLEELAV